MAPRHSSNGGRRQPPIHRDPDDFDQPAAVHDRFLPASTQSRNRYRPNDTLGYESRSSPSQTAAASNSRDTDYSTDPTQDPTVPPPQPTPYSQVSMDTTEKASAKPEARSSVRASVRAYIRRKRAKKAGRRPNQSWRQHLRDRLKRFYKKTILETILRQKPLPPSKDGRHIPLDSTSRGPHGLIDERRGKPYISNFIRSSRYTIYDFIPKQLVYQFSKLGNFYFLVIGSLQLVPGLSTVGSWTTIGPLALFVAFSMAKEGFDDWRRYKLDRVENRSETCVLSDRLQEKVARQTERGDRQKKYRKEKSHGEHGVMMDNLKTGGLVGRGDEDWTRTQWQNVKVGDVIRLRRDEAIPADIALLHATGPNGVAYIETMALDGETNLKSKQASPLLAKHCNTIEGIRSTRAVITAEDPNLDLYSFDGKITVDEETLPLSLNNVVYRGSILRNTTEAIGIVINTGEECKIRMNANKNVRAKKPAMQSIINKMVLLQIVLVSCLTMGLTIGYSLWKSNTERKSFYLFTPGQWDAGVSYTHIFFGYLIMFNTLVPLSLYISLEIIKLGQLLLLQDPEMYDAATNTPMVANTTTILENLGQVSYVFSDKTGTLTENIMRFRKMSVAGVAYLHDMDMVREEEAKQKLAEEMSKKDKGKSREVVDGQNETTVTDNGDFASYVSQQQQQQQRPGPGRFPSTRSASKWRASVHIKEEPELKTEDMLEYIRRHPRTAFSKKAKQFLLCIALCHTCLPERKEDGSIDFQAASPDELALVEAARDLGYLVIDRPAQSIKLQSQDANGNLMIEEYEVLDVIEFSSKRKRMSIIVRMPDGRICVFCKGADNVIMSRLKFRNLADQKAQEISRQASIRRTDEQSRAINRRSTQSPGPYSTQRNSFHFTRGDSARRVDSSVRLSFGRRSSELKRMSESHPEAYSPGSSADIVSPLSPASPSTSVQNYGRVQDFDEMDQRVDENVAASQSATFERVFQHVDEFATQGLRTLLYGYCYIDDGAYAQWKKTYREAETSLVDRQRLIEEAAELIEQNFELAGATAIEDKLQDGVPDTIDKLRRGDIKVWMLTGDKRETAINIGHSARVCKAYSEVYILDSTEGHLRETMTATLSDVSSGSVAHSVVVIDGGTLAMVDADEELAELFYDLVIQVDSVICCRASPSQKARLVKSIRRYVPKSMTLAIGDGANDIGMIQAAHVGIGISGREGLQAARISDFSIAQFRFLQKMLFVHGRWNYMRTGKYVLATFWKEILFFLVQAHFQRYNGYSGTSLYEEWSLTVFNVAFTSLPVILVGIFDKDLSAETLLKVPELYTFGQRGYGFNFIQYFGWGIMGIGGSFLIWYFTEGFYRLASSNDENSLYAMGMVGFTVAVIFINTKLLILEMHCKTIVTAIGFTLSVVLWFCWMLILSGLYKLQLGPYVVRDAFIHNFGRQLSWWASVVLALGSLVVAELAVQAIRRVYWPSDQDLMQRLERDGMADYAFRDREAAAGDGGVETEDLPHKQDWDGRENMTPPT